MMSLRRSVEQSLPYMKDSQSEPTAFACVAQKLTVRRKVRIETKTMLSQLKALLLDAPAVSCPCKLVPIYRNWRIPTIRADTGIMRTMIRILSLIFFEELYCISF